MNRFQRPALLGCALGAAAIMAAASGLFFRGEERQISQAEFSRTECRNLIQPFINSVSWYRGPNRIRIEAAKACSERLPNLYELTDVTVIIESAGLRIAKLHSDSASFRLSENTLLLDHPTQQERGCVPGAETIMLNLREGELRSPGMRMQFNLDHAIHCEPLLARQNTNKKV